MILLGAGWAMKNISKTIAGVLLLTGIIGAERLQAQDFTISDKGIITCVGAQPGDTGTINSIEYTAVDRNMLVVGLMTTKMYPQCVQH